MSNAAIESRRGARRAAPGAVRRDDDDVDLPGGLHRRAPRGHRAHRRRRHAAADPLPAGQAPPHRLRAGGRRVLAALPRRLLRHPLPRRLDGPRGHPRLRLRRHGEPRLRHLPGDAPPRRSRARHPGRAAERRRRDRPRARPHVVRRPGDDEVVERHLAQRGLRHVHGAEGHRRLPARVGALGELRPGPLHRVRHRRARRRPARSSTRWCRRPTPRGCSTSSPTRRAPPSCGCSSSTSARRSSAPASASTWPTTSTATPRPPTCGTPSRRPPASRCAGSWTPGSSRAAIPIVSVDVRGRRPAAPLHARSGSSTSATSTTHTQWAIPLQLRYALESGEVVAHHRAPRRTTRSSSTCRSPSPGWSPTPTATASTACDVSGPLREALVAQAQDGAVRRRALRPRRRHLGLGARRHHRRGGLPRAGRRLRRRDRRVGVAAAARRPRPDRPAGRGRRARAALQARVRALRGPRARAAGLGRAPRRRATATASCAARSSARSPTSAPTPTRGRACASSSSATAPTPTASRPTWPPPSCAPPPPRPAPTEIDTIIERFQHGDTPQEELRFLYALAEVRDPSRWRACSSWP